MVFGMNRLPEEARVIVGAVSNVLPIAEALGRMACPKPGEDAVAGVSAQAAVVSVSRSIGADLSTLNAAG